MSEETSEKLIQLRRDVNAQLIPSGARIFLQAGTDVTITQELGGSITVNIYGNLARIDAADADALGKDSQIKIPESALEDNTVEELVQQQLRSCYDPEIPVNLVDLGLIYECHVMPIGNNEHRVHVVMTLTAAGCGMGPTIAADVKRKVSAVPTVIATDVELTFDPAWDQSRMTEAAKLQMGML